MLVNEQRDRASVLGTHTADTSEYTMVAKRQQLQRRKRLARVLV